jgi:hypothetical protein
MVVPTWSPIETGTMPRFHLFLLRAGRNNPMVALGIVTAVLLIALLALPFVAG